MHANGFFVDADVNDPSQVNTPAALSIGIKDGMQVNQLNTMGANRLLVFTGIVTNRGWVGQDDNVVHGVFRVRLRFPLAPNVIFKASATIAALAGVHGEGDEDMTWGADTVVTVTDPTDNGTLTGKPPLPDNELYVIIDAGYQGGGTNLAGISYQANVLVQDLDPDFKSLVLRQAGTQVWTTQLSDFAPEADYFFEIGVVTTGPVPGPDTPSSFFGVLVDSDNKTYAPVSDPLWPTRVVVPAGYSFGQAGAVYRVISGVPNDTTVKITGTYISPTGKQTINTAIISIARPR